MLWNKVNNLGQIKIAFNFGKFLGVIVSSHRSPLVGCINVNHVIVSSHVHWFSPQTSMCFCNFNECIKQFPPLLYMNRWEVINIPIVKNIKGDLTTRRPKLIMIIWKQTSHRALKPTWHHLSMNITRVCIQKQPQKMRFVAVPCPPVNLSGHRYLCWLSAGFISETLRVPDFTLLSASWIVVPTSFQMRPNSLGKGLEKGLFGVSLFGGNTRKPAGALGS